MATGGDACSAWLGLVCAAAIFLLTPRYGPEPSAAAATADDGRRVAPVAVSRIAFPVLLSIGVIDSAVRMAFLTFLPFLLTAKGANLPTIGLALTLVFAGGAAGKLVCAFIGARIGTIATVWLTEGLTAVAILALLPLSLEAGMLLLPVIGVALNGTSSVLYGSVPDLVAPERRARAFSIFYTGSIGAGALAPALFGIVGDLAGRDRGAGRRGLRGAADIAAGADPEARAAGARVLTATLRSELHMRLCPTCAAGTPRAGEALNSMCEGIRREPVKTLFRHGTLGLGCCARSARWAGNRRSGVRADRLDAAGDSGWTGRQRGDPRNAVALRLTRRQSADRGRRAPRQQGGRAVGEFRRVGRCAGAAGDRALHPARRRAGASAGGEDREVHGGEKPAVLVDPTTMRVVDIIPQ